MSRISFLAAVLLTSANATFADDRSPLPSCDVLRTAGPIRIDGRLDEPSWMGAPAISEFQFPWWKAGLKEQSVVKLLWDDQNLYVACVCSDRHITAMVKDRDGAVYQDDCFEIMVTPNPERPNVYFNIEWNVIGGILDNFRPNGPQQPRAPVWDAKDVGIAGTFEGTLNDDTDIDRHWIVEVAIPFSNFKDHSARTPTPDSYWKVNFNRHGGKTNPQYSQWSAGDTPTPSFHTPHRFGRIVFKSQVVATGQARLHAVPPHEAAARMSLPKGVTVTPFAAEPNIRQPILVKCDDRGRVWVIQYLQYPNPAGLERVKVDRWSRTVYDKVPDPPPRGPKGADRITICEDTDDDGIADRFTDFTDGLNLCTGLALGHGGVFVLQVPYLLFYPDRDHDDRPDSDPEVLLSGFGMEDAQSFANHLTWGPDGWMYGVNGSTTTCNIRGIEFQQGVWRYHPLTKEFELFCEGGGNLFGLTFDANGQLFFTSNGGDLCIHGIQGAYYRKAFGKHGPLHNRHTHGFFVDLPKTTPVVGGPCTGGTFYLADQLTPELAGSFLCGDFLGHTCSWWRFEPKGSTYAATRGGHLVDANDPWFGATDLGIGPDGAVYFSDFHDKRTAHPDPDANWDRSTGRVYRLAAGRPASRSDLDLAKSSPRQLCELLRHKNGWVREQARMQLAERQDTSVHAVLQEWALQTADGQLALEALWALHVSGGFDDGCAAKLLHHPNEHLRLWTIRLIGDARQVSREMFDSLIQLAAHEPEPLVQVQLAATAKRLSGSPALTILLTQSSRETSDSQLPWMIWWGIEDKAMTELDAICKYFADPSRWQTPLSRTIGLHLLRRYAAEGTDPAYEACEQLLSEVPTTAEQSAIEAVSAGLGERSAVPLEIGQGDLFKSSSLTRDSKPHQTRAAKQVSPKLRERLLELWSKRRNDPQRLRAAILAGIDAAYERLGSELANPSTPVAEQLQMLELLTEFGREDCVEAVLPMITSSQPEPVQLAGMRVLQRFDHPKIAESLLSSYAGASTAVRELSAEILLGRGHTAAELLARVDDGRLNASDIPLAQLRRVSVLGDKRLDDLVRKHWGRINAGTAEEKLAVMRRLNNDLRVEKGNATRGKQLFAKHCSSCHRLFEEGEKVGPDLTNSSRHDTEYLLASLVDPNAIIRREYAANTVVTSDGQILTGLIVEQDGAQISLVDQQGKRRRIARSDIDELRESEVSLMPEGLVLTFSPAELRDLFSYLQADSAR